MSRSPIPALISASIALLGFSAITGFLYAYSSSVMLGLDASPAKSAIEAMQGINREVRNFWFSLSFFGAPIYGVVAAIVCLTVRQKASMAWLLIALIVYMAGTFAITVSIHVPMNEALATVETNQSNETLQAVWNAYSEPWSWWNAVRTLAAMLSTLFCGFALYTIRRP